MKQMTTKSGKEQQFARMVRNWADLHINLTLSIRLNGCSNPGKCRWWIIGAGKTNKSQECRVEIKQESERDAG
jgi:hypothetical protein